MISENYKSEYKKIGYFIACLFEILKAQALIGL
jgi:hypothetical protein